MSPPSLHTPLEHATIYVRFRQVFFIETLASKLNLMASTGIFIILRILESSSISSKTYIWGVLIQGKKYYMSEEICLVKITIRGKAQNNARKF